MKNTIARAGAALALSVVAAFGLSACGGDADGSKSDSTADSSQVEGGGEAAADGESEEFVADMQNAVKIINDQIAAEPKAMTQIMLASDVDQPTQKYGMWVMPFVQSDATDKFQSTVQITDGKDFKVEFTSAATGKVWTMDQDGNLAEK